MGSPTDGREDANEQGRPRDEGAPKKMTAGKKLIRFNQCNCARKEFCRMFGQDPSCDEIVPDYPKEETEHTDSGTRFIEENFR